MTPDTLTMSALVKGYLGPQVPPHATDLNPNHGGNSGAKQSARAMSGSIMRGIFSGRKKKKKKIKKKNQSKLTCG